MSEKFDRHINLFDRLYTGVLTGFLVCFVWLILLGINTYCFMMIAALAVLAAGANIANSIVYQKIWGSYIPIYKTENPVQFRIARMMSLSLYGSIFIIMVFIIIMS